MIELIVGALIGAIMVLAGLIALYEWLSVHDEIEKDRDRWYRR